MDEKERPGRWDRLGMSLSGLCLIHCLSLPVLLSVLPLWPFAESLHGWMHPVFAAILIPTTVAAGWYGYRQHRSRRVIGLLAAGLAVVVLGGWAGHQWPGALGETLITMSGSLLLVSGHWRNWRLGATCHVPHAVPAASVATPTETLPQPCNA